MTGRIAELTWRRPKLVLAVVGVLALAAVVYGRSVEHHLKAAGFTDSSSESERARDLLQDRLGYDASAGIVLVVRNPGGGALDPAAPEVRAEVSRLAGELSETRYVGEVVNPLAGPGRSDLIAADGESVVISGHLSTDDIEDEGGIAAEDATERVEDSSLDVSLAGYAPSFNDVNDQTRDDLTTAELIAFPILAILLLIVFRGVAAAAVPLAIGGISIVGAFSLMRAMSEFVDTSLFALNLATALSLGLAVDYALLLISRYREELDAHGATREAHLRTVTTAGRTVLFSGLTVAAALSALILMPQRFLYSIGAAGAGVALLSAVVALLVVPSVLALTGERINALSIRRGPAVSDSSDGWYRLARWVMRRPATVALASTALLLAAASPLLDTKLTGPSAQAVPPGLPAYEANRYVETHYPRGVSEPITVTVDGRASPAELAAYRNTILGTETITGGSAFNAAGPGVAFATFASDRPALEPEPQDAVREIRDLPGPGASETLVSGNTAGFLDQKKSFASNGPLVVGLIAGVTIVLLFLLTGSVVLPLKALLMNMLTLGATLGILVFAFQQGHLDSLFDYTGPGAIEVVSLIFLFAVTFGLATDYAVLVLARIKEQYDGGASNSEAVAIGIARTGRVITAAALMIAVVFLAFAVSPVFFMKQIAIGAALGVLIDATIVRAFLVPSLMRLMGAWNWWAPKPLRWLHWRFGIREG